MPRRQYSQRSPIPLPRGRTRKNQAVLASAPRRPLRGRNAIEVAEWVEAHCKALAIITAEAQRYLRRRTSPQAEATRTNQLYHAFVADAAELLAGLTELREVAAPEKNNQAKSAPVHRKHLADMNAQEFAAWVEARRTALETFTDEIQRYLARRTSPGAEQTRTNQLYHTFLADATDLLAGLAELRDEAIQAAQQEEHP